MLLAAIAVGFGGGGAVKLGITDDLGRSTSFDMPLGLHISLTTVGLVTLGLAVTEDAFDATAGVEEPPVGAADAVTWSGARGDGDFCSDLRTRVDVCLVTVADRSLRSFLR